MEATRPFRGPALNRAIRDYILGFIATERLSAGDSLPSETRLAQDLGVARNSVREAIKALQSLGIVEVRHGEGIFVREPNFDPMLEMITYGIRVDPDTLLKWLDVRMWLEGSVIGDAVARLTDEDIRRLEEIVAAWSEAVYAGVTDHAFRNEKDEAFHRGLYTCLDNDILIKLLEVFWVAFSEFIGPYRTQPVSDLQEHVAILEAVKARDPQAAREALLHNIRRNEEQIHLAKEGKLPSTLP
jgi:DNA-binding FadR family transcriptional regulator